VGRGSVMNVPPFPDTFYQNKVVYGGEANNSVNNSGEGGHIAENCSDQVKVEYTNEAPVQSANDEQGIDYDIERFHGTCTPNYLVNFKYDS
jgi:hypothetical protein